jgi:hypothetical protein
MTLLQDQRNKRAAAKAKHRADADGRQLCAVLAEDGTPVYFSVDPEASTADVSKAAFEAKEGRAMESIEHQLYEIAQRQGIRQ